MEILKRVKKSDFDEFKEISKEYVHKNDIHDIYDLIIPKVDKMTEGIFHLIS